MHGDKMYIYGNLYKNKRPYLAYHYTYRLISLKT